MGENNDAAKLKLTYQCIWCKYAMGALTVGYQVNETDFGTGTSDEDFTAIGISYAVSDDVISILNSSTIDYSSTKDDQEAHCSKFLLYFRWNDYFRFSSSMIT